jgi:hypothetical protein
MNRRLSDSKSKAALIPVCVTPKAEKTCENQRNTAKSRLAGMASDGWCATDSRTAKTSALRQLIRCWLPITIVPPADGGYQQATGFWQSGK